MRFAVISDIHANLHALESVLADVDRDSVDEIWCLGDVVGYGPRPNECCDLIRERAAISLCGNHDLATLGLLDVAEFSGDAATAARWTSSVLGGEQRAWLGSLDPSGRREGAELFHASPRDPVWEYVLSEEVALLSLEATTEPLVLVGHTHVALALALDGDGVDGGLAPGGITVELGEHRFLVNPGSVGQPRDGDPRAAWLLLDTGSGTAAFRRVAYPIEETQKEMRNAALPETLAGRLAHGL
ncbi:MAG TPA: metallophosphoesterase family protein [Gaiellaceae bacterium]|nr:metallophosphoesterase family protein [Gaiellaceae bacterium]